MNEHEQDSVEEQLLKAVSRYDEALVAGHRTVVDAGTGCSPDLEPHLQDLQSCLSLLEKVWPRGPSSAEALGDAIHPGRFGRFQILAELGRGSYGMVLRAFDPRLNRTVALKLPRPEVLITADLRGRFLREAHVVAGLEHPNIVPVFEAGEEKGICYICSAYCPGVTLSSWLHNRTEPVSPEAAAEIVAALADAVQHAHHRGVLHRDIKPNNVLLVASDSNHTATANGKLTPYVPKLVDFGLAKLLEGDGEATKSGVILGTPGYPSRPRPSAGASDLMPTFTRWERPFISYSPAARHLKPANFWRPCDKSPRRIRSHPVCCDLASRAI